MNPTLSRQSSSDHSLSSFFTGTVVGALVALTLGTEDGRKFARNLLRTVKTLGEELDKQTHFSENTQPIRQQAEDRFDSFAKSVNQLNSAIQNTGQQIVNRLHRDTSSADYFTRDGKPLS